MRVAHQLVEQHAVRRCGGQHRLPALQLRSGPRHALRLHRPVDGSDPATDWQGLHTIEESPNAINPATASPSAPTTGRTRRPGAASPRRRLPGLHGPRHREPARRARADAAGGARLHAGGLRDAAYSTRLPAFDVMVPPLVAAGTRCRPAPAEGRDRRADRGCCGSGTAAGHRNRCRPRSPSSGARSCCARAGPRPRAGVDVYEYAPPAPRAAERLEALVAASERLTADFGDWRTPWGEINRFQRLTGDIELPFDDARPRFPSASPPRAGARSPRSARAARGHEALVRHQRQQLRRGGRVRPASARVAVTAGGLNNDPASPHFNDQAERYATGDLREVRFYREDVERRGDAHLPARAVTARRRRRAPGHESCPAAVRLDRRARSDRGIPRRPG
jgi:acyl-homoserine-lactone acylase